MSVYAAGTATLPLAEAESLTESLLDDATSRLCAAVNGWPLPLPVWLQMRGHVAMSRLAGLEPGWPWGAPETVSEDEKAAAEASLRERWG